MHQKLLYKRYEHFANILDWFMVCDFMRSPLVALSVIFVLSSLVGMVESSVANVQV